MFKSDHPSALKALTEDEEYVRREASRYPAPEPDWVEFAGYPAMAEEKCERDWTAMEGDDRGKDYDDWGRTW
jgi:hypothetical protein